MMLICAGLADASTTPVERPTMKDVRSRQTKKTHTWNAIEKIDLFKLGYITEPIHIFVYVFNKFIQDSRRSKNKFVEEL